MSSSNTLRWTLVVALAVLVIGFPIVHYRASYNQTKRLRVVTLGRVYRAGQMTADGFAGAVTGYGIRTILNLQDEFPDPEVYLSPWSTRTVKESELCRRLGVRYVHMPPDLISRRRAALHRPNAIDRFLALLDDPAVYPVLIHCKAGLHRTGVMTAVYRMEYEHWTPRQAIAEMKDNGFGDFACTAANDYITQYVLTYLPGVRQNIARAQETLRTEE